MPSFMIDDVVIYSTNGCCRIDSIEERDSSSYYLLRPVHKDRTKLMVPLDNPQLVARMRPVPSKDELLECLRNAEKAEIEWVDDIARRKEAAHDIMAGGDEYELLVLARTFAQHAQEVTAQGKHPTSSDASILRAVQDRLRDEFSVVFEIDYDEVDEFIAGEAKSMRF